jgi:SAM-dependent methyltransferase
MSVSDDALFRTNCILCGENSFIFPFGKKHFLIKCKNCGLVSSKFIPTSKQLKEYYDDYPSYEKLSDLTIQRYNEILDRLEPFRKNNALLETGCGFGFFLEAAKKRNWNVYGTELSAKAINECLKKNITISASLDEIQNIADKQFDAVVSLEVIEHLNEPQTEVKKYSGLIRSGGALYITTPNYNSFSRLLLGKKWNVILYPEHLHYFSIPTIEKLLKVNNFRPVNRQAIGFSPARFIYALRARLFGVNKRLKSYDYNEKDRQLRDSIEKTILLRLIKKLINKLLAFFKAGDTLKILYQKN